MCNRSEITPKEARMKWVDKVEDLAEKTRKLRELSSALRLKAFSYAERCAMIVNRYIKEQK